MKKVSEVSKEFDVTIRALHHYDDIKLLSPIRINGVRFYDDNDLEKLSRIILFKELKFTLSEIKDLLVDNIDMELLTSKRDVLIDKRNKINDVISLIDTYAFTDLKEIDLDQLNNTFGVSIREKMGDQNLNDLIKNQYIDTNYYVKELEVIFNDILLNLDQKSNLHYAFDRYYNYVNATLKVEYSLRDFGVMAIENIIKILELESEIKEQLIVELSNYFLGNSSDII